MSAGAQAVFIVNIDSVPHDVTVTMADLGLPNTVRGRNLWTHEDMGVITTSYTARGLGVHDSEFLILSPSS